MKNQKCPECGKHTTTKFGFRFSRVGKIQKYHCNSCGHVFTLSASVQVNK